MTSVPRPGPLEYAPHYAKYIDLVPEGDLVDHLLVQARHFTALLANIEEARGLFRYAPGKWSIKELVGHICDTERIMSYRLLRIARGDTTPLAGFDMDAYVLASQADNRTLEDLAQEFTAIRQATLSLLRTLGPEALSRQGIASEKAISASAIAHVIPGHLAHHARILEERYIL